MSFIEFAQFFDGMDKDRDSFLARVLGIFNEELARAWCSCPEAPWENLGRPTLKDHDGNKVATLDLMLRERKTGRSFFSEMKCWVAYEDQKYLSLDSAGQLARMARLSNMKTLAKFLDASSNPGSVVAYVDKRIVPSEGGVLVWASVTERGRAEVMEEYGLHTVLSAESMLRDLLRWRPEWWIRRVEQLAGWSQELYDYLSGKPD